MAAEGAEDPHAFQDRVMSLVLECAARDDTTLLVSHMGVGKAIEAYRRQTDPSGFFDYPPYPNAHVVELELQVTAP